MIYAGIKVLRNTATDLLAHSIMVATIDYELEFGLASVTSAFLTTD